MSFFLETVIYCKPVEYYKEFSLIFSSSSILYSYKLALGCLRKVLKMNSDKTGLSEPKKDKNLINKSS